MRYSFGFNFIVILILISINYNSESQIPVFYGTTNHGGSYGKGVIFSFNPLNDTEKVVWNFGGSGDGSYPVRNLVYDVTKELFYCTTPSGGIYNSGALISFNPYNESEKVLWSFGNGKDVNTPYCNLVFDSNMGVYFGMTCFGGATDSGAIFSFNANTLTETIVWNFKGKGIDGTCPYADLVYNSTTKLYYGTTISGGKYNKGTIISFNLKNNNDSLCWSFGKDSDGWRPCGNLIYDNADSLYYATAYFGGNSNKWGTIISFNPFTGKEAVVWNFGSIADGEWPVANLSYDSNNKLFYGITPDGGYYDDGSIYKFNPVNNDENVVYIFSQYSLTSGDLSFTGDTIFYGMTRYTGQYYSGTIFKFNPVTNTFTVLWNFGKGSDGKCPVGNLTLINRKVGNVAPVTLQISFHIYPNPNNGKFTIQWAEAQHVAPSLEIYNIYGEIVGAKYLSHQNTQIDMSNQPSGVYFYKVITDNGEFSENGKIIIAK
jgi:uncharacterized repeat protein (TIGR03803 family)